MASISVILKLVMLLTTKTLLCATALIPIFMLEPAAEPAPSPEFTSAGELKYPDRYREWIFLGSGLGMTYGPAAAAGQNRPPMFDNVFVNPTAYRAFLESGKWPDKTVLILEVRNSESHASINKDGHFQTDTVAMEAHVKDQGTWTFYGFNRGATSAKAVPRNANCYTCHSANAAVENTFVQFYPELYKVAVHKGTLNKSFTPLPMNASELSSLIAKEPWDKAKTALNQLATQAPDANSIGEGSLNLLAYALMSSGKASTAVELLAWTASRYPQSSNLQDSLADAYLATGDKANAMAASQRALAMVDKDTSIPEPRRVRVRQSAQERLKKLEK
ncbi:MAG: cytochrome P460 family protein [Chloroflexia bacterium]